MKKLVTISKTILPLFNKILGKSIAITLLVLFQIICFSYSANAQTLQVKGKITDDKGETLIRATVRVRGTTQGTVTDTKGIYSIKTTSGSTLVFSYIGFISQEVKVTSNADVNIRLQPLSQSLEQVVVVGYGTQRKKDVTGAIVSVNEQALREVPVANLQQALQGKAAGLEIQRAGTTPGSGAQIRIRGMRSINGSNDPLVVLDGIPFDGSLNDINPDDVASIDILKDASSTAIYGSRGANGVILVTTKKGISDETRVTYSGYYGFSKVANKYPVFSPIEYRAMRDYSTWSQGYMPDELASIASGKSTDWQDQMYKSAFRTDHNVSVSGGHAGSTYSFGGGSYKETAVIPGQDFTRYSVRAAIDSKIGNRIKVGLSSLNSVGITNGSQFVNPMFPVIALSPLMPAYDAQGRINIVPNGDVDDNNSPQLSPLLLKNNNNSWVDKTRSLRTINSLYGEYQFAEGLKYRLNLGLTYSQSEGDQFKSSGDSLSKIAGAYPTHPSYFQGYKGNTASVRNDEAWGYTVENLLTYEKTIARKHRVSFTGLFSTQEYKSHWSSIAKDSITEDFVQFYNLGLSSATPAPVVNGGESSWAMLSYMARINYVFNDLYMLTLTGRSDGSSRLASGHYWHQYPAVSAGWNISNESFMKNIKAISNLKLRGGFGQTSNQAIAPYSSLGLVTNNNYLTSPGNIIRYNYGPTVVTGYQVNTLRNTYLDWEYTKTLNIGLDFAVLDYRISGSVEYYQQKTEGLLYNVTLPSTSGVAGNYLTNIGQMQNRGFELSLNTKNIQTENGLNWSTDFNMFFNRNKVLKLSNNITQDIANQLFVGYSMSSIYDYKKTGIWQISEAAEAAKFGSVPGQIKLADISGPNGVPDGLINDFDRSIIGDGDAKIQGGMTNKFSFKGIDFSFFVFARLGGTMISQIHQPVASYLTNMDGKRNGIKVDYWTPTNPTNWFPSPSLATISPISTAWTTLGYYSASFVKIRSINLGYNFESTFLNKINAKSARIYCIVDNVATLFSPYMKQTGIDPESTAIGNQGVGNPGNIRANTNGNGTVVVNAGTPPSRTYTVGINITF